MPSCKVPDCTKPAEARGLCSAHRARLRRHGSPYAITRRVAASDAVSEFLHNAISSFASNPTTECLFWPFARDRDGYGRVFRRRRNYYAHRIVCFESHGPPPPDKPYVLHSCNNRSCCNPAHLRWGSSAENHADRIASGNGFCDRSPHAKLSISSVLFIRASSLPQETLAAAFNTSISNVDSIQRRRTWRHLRDDGVVDPNYDALSERQDSP